MWRVIWCGICETKWGGTKSANQETSERRLFGLLSLSFFVISLSLTVLLLATLHLYGLLAARSLLELTKNPALMSVIPAQKKFTTVRHSAVCG